MATLEPTNRLAPITPAIDNMVTWRDFSPPPNSCGCDDCPILNPLESVSLGRAPRHFPRRVTRLIETVNKIFKTKAGWFSPSHSARGPGEGLAACFTPHPNPLPRGARGLSAVVFNFVVRLIVIIFYCIVIIPLATVNSYKRT